MSPLLHYMKRFIFVAIITFLTFQSARSGMVPEAASDQSRPPYVPEILVVESDNDVADLEAAGVIIWHRRADMVLALVPTDRDSQASSLKAAYARERHRVPGKAFPTMDIAKTYLSASSVLSGHGLPQAYTGKGIVVGFCDIAFDPNHINFKDEEGRLRVKKLAYYDEPNGIRTILNTPEEISEWTTDDAGSYHATHVAGIMAGSFNGNGYGGMAPDSEIVGATCKLYDVGILASCEEIISYAKSVGKPAVINLSLGNCNGPHDGSSLFCRYLTMLGQEAIICIAAGNAGDDHSSYRAHFTEPSPAWRVIVEGNDWVHYNIYGMTDAWSYDNRPVSARFLVYDTDSGEYVYESELIDFSSSEEIVISSSEDADLAKYMEGTIYFDGYVSPHNDRWVTEIMYETSSTASAAASGGRWARYRPALEFSAAPGVKADINSDSNYSFLNRAPGFNAPNADISVSDIATGDNVVVVGMYNSRNHMPTLSGADRVFSFEPFTVNEGSGYGTLVDGRVLPHVVAPGAGIISSSNRYYTLANPDAVGRMNAAVEIDGETYYWGSDAGTSMSTPYVAGVIASWLEADPTLTVDKVRDILEQTNYTGYPEPENPRHGGGWLQPYEGLKKVIAETGITPGSVDSGEIKVIVNGSCLEILNPSSEPVLASIYSMEGSRPMPSVVISGSLSTIPLDNLSPGIYILRLQCDSRTLKSLRFVR